MGDHLALTHGLLIGIAFLAANLPWIGQRFLYVVPLARKGLGWSIVELAVLYGLIGGVAYLAERSSVGQVSVQHWEFYVTTASLFLVFAFPGFAWRYLWRR